MTTRQRSAQRRQMTGRWSKLTEAERSQATEKARAAASERHSQAFGLLASLEANGYKLVKIDGVSRGNSSRHRQEQA